MIAGSPPVALCTLLAGMLLAWCPCAFALNPELDVSQYAHTAWKIRDGFPKGLVYSIAQTPDGYLWLGTEFGLVLFDGVKNTAWQPPPDQHLPSSQIWSLLAARDGLFGLAPLRGLQVGRVASSLCTRSLLDRWLYDSLKIAKVRYGPAGWHCRAGSSVRFRTLASSASERTAFLATECTVCMRIERAISGRE